MKEDNLGKFKEIFASALNLETGSTPEKIRLCDFSSIKKKDGGNWDSIAHLSIIAGIESEFDVTIDGMDFERMISFSAIEALLTEKGL
jgi:acyl carrier protein